jgi:hypothetical protein
MNIDLGSREPSGIEVGRVPIARSEHDVLGGDVAGIGLEKSCAAEQRQHGLIARYAPPEVHIHG